MLALKFVEAVILLYTPDPNGLSEPPPEGNKILLRILGSVGFFFFYAKIKFCLFERQGHVIRICEYSAARKNGIG